ncbi:MAG: DoxX family protein [Candidatus Paceibacterota bacterium]
MINFLLVFSDWAILALRIILGLVLIFHGYPKIKNLKKNAKDFNKMGFKPGMFWGSLVAILEVVGGVALIAGFLTQTLAIIFIVQFIVIMLTIKRNAGFKGVEMDLLIVGGLLVLVTIGGGVYSLDNFLGLLLY